MHACIHNSLISASWSFGIVFIEPLPTSGVSLYMLLPRVIHEQCHMFVNMYLYVCIHTYTYIHVYTHQHCTCCLRDSLAYVYIYIYIYIHKRTHKHHTCCLHGSFTCARAMCMHGHAHVSERVCVCVCMCGCVNTKKHCTYCLNCWYA